MECRVSRDFCRVILQRDCLLDRVVGRMSKDLCLAIIADFLVGNNKFPMFWGASEFDAAFIMSRPEFCRTNDSLLLLFSPSTYGDPVSGNPIVG